MKARPTGHRILQEVQQCALMVAHQERHRIHKLLPNQDQAVENFAGMVAAVDIVAEKHDPHPAIVGKSRGVVDNLLKENVEKIMAPVDIANRVDPLGWAAPQVLAPPSRPFAQTVDQSHASPLVIPLKTLRDAIRPCNEAWIKAH